MTKQVKSSDDRNPRRRADQHVDIIVDSGDAGQTTGFPTQGNRVLMLDLAGQQRLGHEWACGAPVMDHFQDLEAPRIERSKRHGLLDILTIAICAVICGADSWVYVEMFGKSKEEWFRGRVF